tara:strand:+ start:2176 stop:2637 length:462 start_codon:yes stop_codon:yes gene_type:complete
MSKKIIIGITFLATIGCIIGVVAFIMNFIKNKNKKDKYQKTYIPRSDCFRPGMCGFEELSYGSNWCWTTADEKGSNWEYCTIDENSNPWEDCKAYIGKPNSKNISDACLNALWNDSGCDGNISQQFTDWAKTRTIKDIINENHNYRKGWRWCD